MDALDTSLPIAGLIDTARSVSSYPELPNVQLALAAAAQEYFQSTAVSIWDYSAVTNALVHEVTIPGGYGPTGRYGINAKLALTAPAILAGERMFFTTLDAPSGPRRFLHRSLLESLKLSTALAIPLVVGERETSSAWLLNVYFASHATVDPDDVGVVSFQHSAMGLLDYVALRLDEQLRLVCDAVIAESQSLTDLLPRLGSRLRRIGACKRLTVFYHDALSGHTEWWLSAERDEVQRTGEFSPYTHLDAQTLASRVAMERGTRALVQEVRLKSVPWEHPLEARIVGVPVLSRQGPLSAVLVAQSDENDSVPYVFSSMDLRGLEVVASRLTEVLTNPATFAHANALVATLHSIADGFARSLHPFDFLQTAIESLSNALRVEVGSIFLLDAGEARLELKASWGYATALPADASYAIGEGITGHIATGGTINLRSRAEILAHPQYRGKYDASIWGSRSDESPRSFLGVPMRIGRRLVGVLKVSNISRSREHPESYFTELDQQVVEVVVTLLTSAVEQERIRTLAAERIQLLARASVDIENAQTEETAVACVFTALESAGFDKAVLFVPSSDGSRLEIDRVTRGPWNDALKEAHVVSSWEIYLRKFIADDADHLEQPAMPESVGAELWFHTIAPEFLHLFHVRSAAEHIGVLAIDYAARDAADPIGLTLRALSGHLAITIARLRSETRSQDLTDQVISGSRFIVAETLSSLAVHSVGHRLDEILSATKVLLGNRQISENRLLHESIVGWRKALVEEKADVRAALSVLRTGGVDGEKPPPLEPIIQEAIDLWIKVIRSHKATIQVTPEAARSVTHMPAYAFKEVLSVLIVNAVQAYAKTIKIRTYNAQDVRPQPGHIIADAFCLEFMDDGNGVAAGLEEQLFLPTFTTKPDKFGTGLGLYIARALANRAGGSLVYLSERQPKKGALFTLMLPVES